MSKIVKQFTKFIFPFAFDKEKVAPLSAITTNRSGKAINLFNAFSVQTESLREGLELLLDKNGDKTKIADCYELDNNCRKYFSLPSRKSEYLDFICRQNKDEIYKVAISDVKFYLFESEVGFFEIECEYETDLIEEYIDLNYFICEIKSDKNYFTYHEKVWNEQEKTNQIIDHAFTIKELVEKIIVSISPQKAIDLTFKKVKPLVYSYVLLDQKLNNIENLLAHLDKNYKSSYKFDDTCSETKIFHPFENSFWASSLNGSINLSFLTKDEVTDEFFTNNFPVKVKNTYYFLFLNVLHQRNAISRIMAQMGQLDQLEKNYLVMKKQLKLARKYEAQALNLKFRAFFRFPSSVEHINEYYNLLYSTFQVGQLFSSFTLDISNLQNICKTYVDRIKAREEKLKKIKNSKIEIFVSIFGTLVGEVTLLDGSWSMIERLLGHEVSFFSPVILILVGTLILPLITIIVNVVKQAKEIKQLKDDILGEVKDELVESDDLRKKRKKESKKKDAKANANKQ